MMQTFSYEALDKSGRTIRGTIDARNENVIIDKLQALGYLTRKQTDVTKVDLLALPGLRGFFHRVRSAHLVAFSRQLATLLNAGLPILRSLRILEEQTESVVFKQRIHEMAENIEQGASLYQAMQPHKKIFGNLYLNMIRAGEIGGVLEAVLNKIADYQERRVALVGKICKAMIYPTLVMFLATVITSIILVWIVPQFQEVFQSLNAELPWLTLQLVYASELVHQHGFVLLVFGFVLWLIYRSLNNTRDGKLVIDKTKLRLPIFGSLFLKASIARFSGTLSTLMTAGVPILQALEMTRDTADNEVVSRALQKVYENVRDGESIHEPLRDTEVFPALVVHMIAVGEETGMVDFMMQKVSESYQREVDDAADAFASIIEPVLMVFLGLVIGTIVVALYLPLIMLGTVVINA